MNQHVEKVIYWRRWLRGKKNARATERLLGKAEPCFHKIDIWENFHSLSSHTVVHYIFNYTSLYLIPYYAGGRRFKPRPEQHSGSQNN